MTSAISLRDRLHKLSMKAALIEGAQKADASRQAELVRDVSMAKARLGLADEASRVFEALQQRAHERSVGAFERLLSAILSDVLPNEGQVRLLPQFKNNATWLDIALEKNGALEDLVDGNGGAVTNVVCTGLRFAALSRTGNRRLMILDEPDCWLKPEKVPAFVRVVAEVSAQAGTQTFFITHHDPSYFEGRVNVVKFHAAANNAVAAKPLAPLMNEWKDDAQPGIRCIELINVRRHIHTVVPCFPGATAFIGDNNLGKSTAVVTSFKAVAYGESDDSIVRHGAEEARIVFHLENNQRIEWIRSLKKSPAVVYRHWRGDELVTEGRPKTRNTAPEWVTEILGISRVDDLDIQVGNQKSPVFLLNDSAPRRAQILSVGRESGHLKTFMKKYSDLRVSDQETAKRGELELARLKVRLAYMAKLAPLQPRLADLVERSETTLRQLENRERLESVLKRLEERTAAIAQLERECEALRSIPEVPALHDESALTRCIERLVRHSRIAALTLPPELPTLPVLHDVSLVLALGQRLARAHKISALLEKLPGPVPVLPELYDLERLQQATVRLAARGGSVKSVEQELNTAQQELAAAQVQMEKTIQDLGGECPLCGSAFTAEGIEHVH